MKCNLVREKFTSFAATQQFVLLGCICSIFNPLFSVLYEDVTNNN